ncbi:MAG TPA: hypothetical protein VIT85_01810 [Solirubrobacterales bacterium]
MKSAGVLLTFGIVLALALLPAVAGSAPKKCEGRSPTNVGGDGNNRIRGTEGPDTIDAGAGDDTIRGLGGDDRVCGGEGNDTVYGGEGDDAIRGGEDFDTLVGDAGDDAIEPEAGHDIADGGPGSDTVVYRHERAGVIVNLAANTTRLSAGRDSLPSIENVIGSRFTDILAGDKGANVLRGGGGVDELSGGGGKDTLVQ